MRRQMIFLACLAGAGFAIGLMLPTLAVEANGRTATDQWRTPVQPTDYSESANRFRSDLIRSGLFPIAPDQTTSDTAGADEAAEDLGPDFPEILSVAQIDGEYTLQVRLEDQSITSVRAGDRLPGDWVVQEVTFNQVSALGQGELVNLDLAGR